jgi:hypothetical protein
MLHGCGKHYRCRYCGYDVSAWLLVAKRPNGVMHRDQVMPDPDRAEGTA